MKAGFPLFVIVLALSCSASAATRVAILCDASTEAASVSALLESDLAGQPNITLVECSQIDQIIKEQELQDCFAADAVEARARLGQLVHADVLTLLRNVSPERAHIEIVVCETHHGLRLLAQEAAISNDPQADAAAIRQSVVAAIEKSRQKITSIVAVPPMVCNDLSYEFAYLGPAYARLIEDSLLSRNGVLVVELAEARALEKELLLDDRNTIDRPLPLYLLGDYADEGIGSARRMVLTVTLRQGQKVISSIKSGQLVPGEVPAFLLKNTDHLLALAGDAINSPPDPTAEAALLADQAHIHQRLGEWDEALNLLEASLMLDPSQMRLHVDAINILHSILIPPDISIAAERAFFEEHGDQWMLIKERELEHFEPWFRAIPGGLTLPRLSQIHQVLEHCGGIYNSKITPNRFKEKALELDRYKRELFFTVLEERLKAGQTDFYGLGVAANTFCIGTDSIEEDQQVRLRAIRLLKDSPYARQSASLILLFGKDSHKLGDPSFERLLSEAATIDTPGVQAGIAQVRHVLNANRAQAATQPVSRPSGPKVLFHQLAPSTVDEAGRPLKAPQSVINWLPVGDHIDAVFDHNSLYLMKEKGRLQRLFTSDEECFQSSQPAFDGQYLWAPVVEKAGGCVLVVDPAQGRIISRISNVEGLPPITVSGCASALGHGRVCVSGGFGRGWIASLQINPIGVQKIRVFFEAKDSYDPKYGSVNLLHTAFAPAFIYQLREKTSDKHAATRLAVGRLNAGNSYCLLVDPDSESVTVSNLWLPTPSGQFFTNEDGQIFLTTWVRPPPPAALCRYSLPELRRPTRICSLSGFGPIIFLDGKVYIASDYLIVANGVEGPFGALAGPIPGNKDSRMLFRSTHYGLVVGLYNGYHGVYAVELPKDP